MKSENMNRTNVILILMSAAIIIVAISLVIAASTTNNFFYILFAIFLLGFGTVIRNIVLDANVEVYTVTTDSSRLSGSDSSTSYSR
jgi:fucose permease